MKGSDRETMIGILLGIALTVTTVIVALILNWCWK